MFRALSEGSAILAMLRRMMDRRQALKVLNLVVVLVPVNMMNVPTFRDDRLLPG